MNCITTIPLTSIGLPPSMGCGNPRAGMRDNANLLFGCAILGVALLMALAAPMLAPDDPYVQRLAARLVPPAWFDGGAWSHPLGTDALGRDMASRLIYGVRVSLLIG